MGSSGLFDSIVSFAQKNTVAAVIIALVLLLFIYRKPKMFFILLFLGLLVAGVLYMIMNMAGSGSEHKKKLIQEEEEKQSNTNPSSPLGGRGCIYASRPKAPYYFPLGPAFQMRYFVGQTDDRTILNPLSPYPSPYVIKGRG